jgi:hypothetical protein
VEAAWAIVVPAIQGSSPMDEYEPGTWGSGSMLLLRSTRDV